MEKREEGETQRETLTTVPGRKKKKKRACISFSPTLLEAVEKGGKRKEQV